MDSRGVASLKGLAQTYLRRFTKQMLTLIKDEFRRQYENVQRFSLKSTWRDSWLKSSIGCTAVALQVRAWAERVIYDEPVIMKAMTCRMA